MADEDQIIKTVDENGNEVEFELFDIVEGICTSFTCRGRRRR